MASEPQLTSAAGSVSGGSGRWKGGEERTVILASDDLGEREGENGEEGSEEGEEGEEVGSLHDELGWLYRELG